MFGAVLRDHWELDQTDLRSRIFPEGEDFRPINGLLTDRHGRRVAAIRTVAVRPPPGVGVSTRSAWL